MSKTPHQPKRLTGAALPTAGPQELRYRSLRNAETLASYCKWVRASSSKGWPLMLGSALVLFASSPFFTRVLLTRDVVTGSIGAGLVLLWVVMTTAGLVRVLRYEKRHARVEP